MTFPLFRRAPSAATIGALYGAIVAQARHPLLYADYGVPDTVEARFDMIALHVVLLFRRMRHEAGAVRALGQGVFDRFCKDMEHNLREMGVSDMALPSEMRRLGEAFYGRAAAYEEALAFPHDEALVAALQRNVLAGDAHGDARCLASYVRALAADLAVQDISALAQGAVRFPEPAAPPMGADVA